MCNNIGIKGYSVNEVVDKQQYVEVHATILKPQRRCPCCGADQPRSKGLYIRRAQHLEYFGRKAMLVVHARRNECKQCKKTYNDMIPGIRPYRRSSESLRDKIYEDHQDGISGACLALRHQIGPATVERIHYERTYLQANERIHLECPTILGIDEHTIHKGYRMATTFCNLSRNKVFDIVEGRSAKDLEGFLSRLKGRHRVKVICIDLSSSYRSLLKRWFPKAKIVADRFHAMRLAIHHFMQLARELVATLPWNRSWLRILRKHRKNLTQDELRKLEVIFQEQPVLQEIHQRKERLCELLNQKTQTAKQCKGHIQEYKAIQQELMDSKIPRMMKLAKTLQEWEEPIARMWRFSKNNGITEGFHRKMKLIQRRAYGFRNFNNYRLRVIAQCG